MGLDIEKQVQQEMSENVKDFILKVFNDYKNLSFEMQNLFIISLINEIIKNRNGQIREIEDEISALEKRMGEIKRKSDDLMEYFSNFLKQPEPALNSKY